jgi:biotin transport system substrate-specific component
MTMQTLVALLIGIAFGFRVGAATVLLYLAEGAAGLPVFAGTPEKGIGIAYMIGPTGGYLLGFALGAAVAGWITERRRDTEALVLAVIAGSVAIYAPGVVWLASFVGVEQALDLGLVPFLWGDILKGAPAIALAMGGAAMVRRRLGI